MRKPTQAVTLFYSSTNDEFSSNRKSIVEKVAKLVEQSQNVAIQIIYWKDNIPGGISGGVGQDRIDQEVNGAFDVYFGCMGVKYGKGTVQEFTQAIESHIRTKRPTEILFAFDETPINPFHVPNDFSKVKKFKKSLESSKTFGRSILYFSYSNAGEFENCLFRDLNEAVRKSISRICGGMPKFI